MNILLYTLSVPLGFGVMSLFLIYFFSKPIMVWCRKRWVRVFKKYENNTELNDYLYTRLASDQMESLYFEAVFSIVCILLAIGLTIFGFFTLFKDGTSNLVWIYVVAPAITLVPHLWYFSRNINLFTKLGTAESQFVLTKRYLIYLGIVGIVICFYNAFCFQNPYALNYIMPPILVIVGIFLAIIFFAIGRLGVIQINKHLPLPFHAQQTDLLIQALLLSRPEYTRQWLKTNMDHENPKIASFARKWTERYL